MATEQARVTVSDPAVDAPALVPDATSRIRRTLAAATMGTALEMYDFVLYGTAAALVFNRIFFPQIGPIIGALAAIATYGVGFVTRPLGGLIFGHLGDRIGRKSVLIITMLGMGILSALIGLVPDYATIGIWAPIILVALRLAQGVALGGELGGAYVMAAEAGGMQTNRRGFFGSWPVVGLSGGLVLATLIFGLFARLDQADLLSWGWRVPFLLSLVLVGIGLFVRLRVAESEVFEDSKRKNTSARAPLVELLRRYWRQVLLVMGMRAIDTAAFFTLATFSVAYTTQFLRLPQVDVLNAVLAGAVVNMVTIPLWGALSDRIGRKPVMIGAAAFFVVFIFPFFLLLNTRSMPLIYLAIIIAMAGHAAVGAPAGAFFSEMFGTRVRLSGISVGVQFTAMIVGGLTPIILSGLLAATGQFWPIAVYVAALALVSLICIAATPESYRSERLPSDD